MKKLIQKKLDKNDLKEIVENAISWVVVFAMFIYGGAKIVQFDGATEIEKAVSQMAGMELMWAFYGYSYAFSLTLGFLEILGGVLILIRKTRLIGCLFTSTILVNIIIQDIVYGIPLGALRVAIIYQLLILIVLWINRIKLIQSLKTLLISNAISEPRIKVILKIIIAFLIFLTLRILEYFITIKW